MAETHHAHTFSNGLNLFVHVHGNHEDLIDIYGEKGGRRITFVQYRERNGNDLSASRNVKFAFDDSITHASIQFGRHRDLLEAYHFDVNDPFGDTVESAIARFDSGGRTLNSHDVNWDDFNTVTIGDRNPRARIIWNGSGWDVP